MRQREEIQTVLFGSARDYRRGGAIRGDTGGTTVGIVTDGGGSSEYPVRSLPTEQLIEQLCVFGVPFEVERFREEATHFQAAYELAEHWQTTTRFNAVMYDLDFVSMACTVLW